MLKLFSIIIIASLFLSQTVFVKHTKNSLGTNSWPPFRMHENEQMSGIDFEVWEEIEKRLDFRITFMKLIKSFKI